ncbi:MAG: DUF397 domain-containing protein [Actinomycetota bacterium]|nr:DUF397 domain-containing protein [Actinomycetota bacterium]
MTAPELDSIVWRTSSYSPNGSACVEIGWRTSSYSGSGADCVEVAAGPDVVLVRDSKDRDGPALTVPTTAWRAFLHTITR